MPLDTGTIIVVVAIALFYVRVVLIWRDKAKRAKLAVPAPPKPAKRKKKGVQPVKSADPLEKPILEVTNWYLVGVAVVIMLLGVAMKTSVWTFSEYWWIPITLGIIVLNLGVRSRT
jgi:hypothetical protein